MKTKPNDLIDAGAERNSFNDLQRALHLAVKLELFTIPFYFYTFYSLKNPKSPVGIHLREVIMEEMLHLAIISNIMHALKGCTRPAYSPIKELGGPLPCADLVKKYVPIYPGYAPIYRHKGEKIEEGDRRSIAPKKAPYLHLDSLTKEQIVAFLRLELPELPKETDPEGWQTIGEFYNYVKTQFLSSKKLEFNSQDQIELYTHNPTKERNTMRPIRNLKDALDNIDFIVEQGEGATFYNLAKHEENLQNHKKALTENTLVATEVKKTELAHFYHFLLIYNSMGGLEPFTIESKEFDDEMFLNHVDPVRYEEFRKENVINLVKDPAQSKRLYPPEAARANDRFNENYTRMLDRLTYASVDDHRLNFGIALEQMSKFDELADDVKQYHLEKDPTTFCGPTFEYVCPPGT